METSASFEARSAPLPYPTSEYPIPIAASGPRAIIAVPDGRLFFTADEVGAIGEVIP